jgi:hypothetical protein
MQEARITKPWTVAEKEAFKKEFLEHFKDFPALAAAMGTRSVLEITKHFYEVRKKDEFKNHDRKFTLKKRRDGIKERNEKNSMFGPLSTATPRSSTAPLLSTVAPLAVATPGVTPGSRRGMSHSLDSRSGAAQHRTATVMPVVGSPNIQSLRPRGGPAPPDDDFFHGKNFQKGAAAPKGSVQPARSRQNRNKDHDARILDDPSVACNSVAGWMQPKGGVCAAGPLDMAKVMRVPKLDTSVEVPPLDSVLPAHSPPLAIAGLNTGERNPVFATTKDGISSPCLLREAFSEGSIGLPGPMGCASLLPTPLQDRQHLVRL